MAKRGGMSLTESSGAKATSTHSATDCAAYIVPDDALASGASLGNAAVWINTKGTGAIERVFCVGLGASLIGSIRIRYAGAGRPVLVKRESDRAAYMALRQESVGTFDVHPAYQRHRFTLMASLAVDETTFLPLTSAAPPGDDPPIVYTSVRLRNDGATGVTLRVVGAAHLRGTLAADVRGRYDPQLGAIVASNVSRPQAVRVFGVSVPADHFATTFDFGSLYDPAHVDALGDSTDACGDVLGCLQLDLTLAPGEDRRFAFVTAVSGDGEEAAIAAYRSARDAAEPAFEQTLRQVDAVSQRAIVLTPDPLVNAGALWSKVNMLRVMAHYPSGPAFTNEPGISSNVVGRDAFWFIHGNDHFQPDFSRALIAAFARAQYESGKIPEFYNARTGEVEDYGLNINDDTPLFVLAVAHHYAATGELAWLRSLYPAVARALRYVTSVIDERGLVYCSANDPRGNVWAIASWRNVIPGYAINGAVTELNAECAAAFRSAAQLAEHVGDADAANEFGTRAQSLSRAMDEHLINPVNGLYYLNIDVDGNVHTDVTGDQVFPVMLRVCDEETGYRIISRLNAPDFRTAAGLRTVSRNDPLYDPTQNVGLLGGVWPGLTWWYAYAAARYHPEFMVDALRASFGHYAADPKGNNTVPGQFSEWFDGESLVNRGMRLSPWEPCRFLWATIEGVCGLTLSRDVPEVRPLVPAAWRWVALRRAPYQGRELTYVATRRKDAFHIDATSAIKSEHQSDVYAEDVTSLVASPSPAVAIVALRRPGRILVFIGNIGAETAFVPVNFDALLEPHAAYRIRFFNSERGAWERPEHPEGADVRGTRAVALEAYGFRLIELEPHVDPTDARTA